MGYRLTGCRLVGEKMGLSLTTIQPSTFNVFQGAVFAKSIQSAWGLVFCGLAAGSAITPFQLSSKNASKLAGFDGSGKGIKAR